MEETQQLSFDFAHVQPHITGARDGGGEDEIKLRLGEFDGPLDLLLYLIRQAQVSIFDLPVARIADEYLRYIRLMKTLDISIAGDFLVMAATLIEIKSKMLLPRDPLADPEEVDEEDPREALIRQLLEHEKFKNAAQMLYERSTVEQAVFGRGKLETDEENPETNATVFDLLNVFQKIAARHRQEIKLEIKREELSLAEMLRVIKERVSAANNLNLNDFFTQTQTKRELVLAFLAVLELVKMAAVKLIQDKVFGEIWLQAV